MASVLGSFLKGKKPKVPDLALVSPEAEQGAAVRQNIAATPDIQALASSWNIFNFEQLQSMLAKSLPLFQRLKEQQAGLLSKGLAGELSEDVLSQVERSGVAKSAGQGTLGSGRMRNLVARDISQTSYQISQQALAATDRWMQAQAAMQIPNMFDFSSMFVTPQQRMSLALEQNAMQWNRNWLKNKIKAMPSPQEAALGSIADELGSAAISAAGMAMGGAMGGIGGMGGSKPTATPNPGQFGYG